MSGSGEGFDENSPWFGPYQLISRIGRGGMGEVWRAVDSRKDRTVALKILGPWLAGDAEIATRFRREAALAARVGSPNIVPIHDYGEIDSQLYIDMALIDGFNLADLLKRNGPLAPHRALEIVGQVGKALDAAHQAGLIHRDVKPSNILLTNGREDHVYLIDFGIALAVDVGATRLSLAGAMIGTPAYMAPERFEGLGDHRSDIYSLGCVLYELLAGRVPYPASSPLIAMNAHYHASPPRIVEVRADVSLSLDEAICRAMAKSPESRFTTATELIDAASGRVAAAAPSALDARWLRTAKGPSTTLLPRARIDGFGLGGHVRRTRRRIAIGSLIVALAGVLILIIVLGASGWPSPRTASALVLAGHSAGVSSTTTAVLDGRTVLVSAGRDRTLRVWDPVTGAQVGPSLSGHTREVMSVIAAQIAGRAVIVSGSLDGTIRVWDLASHAVVGEPIDAHSGGVDDVAVAQRDGRTVIVSGGNDDTVRLWDLTTQVPVGQPFVGHSDFVTSVEVTQYPNREGDVIVSGSGDRTVRRWDVATGREVGAPLTGHSDYVTAIAVGEIDGQRIAVSGSSDASLREWNLPVGSPIGTPFVGHGRGVTSVAITEFDGRRIVISGSLDSTVRLWDLVTHESIGQPLAGHLAIVEFVTVARVDGRDVIITASNDAIIRVWDLAGAVRA